MIDSERFSARSGVETDCGGGERIILGPVSLGWQIALALASSTVAMQTPVPPGTNGAALSAARIVSGILSYSGWPVDPDPVRLCLTGSSEWAGAVTSAELTGGRMLNVTRLAPSAVTPALCHAVYIGQMAPPDRSRLISSMGNSTILTITDADPQCEFGAMFCLRLTPQGMVFDLNVGAVSRSRVRVDPRVLALSRRERSTP